MTALLTSAMSAKDAARRLGRDRSVGSRYLASCPVEGHGKGKGDRDPSLSLWDDDEGRLAYNCLGGCAHSSVRDALISKGILSRDDQDTPRSAKPFNPTTKPIAKPTAKPAPKKAADEWEHVPLDTPNAPNKSVEQVLIDGGVLERSQQGLLLLLLLLLTKDSNHNIISRSPVTALKTYQICLHDGRPALIDVRIEFGWQSDKNRPDKDNRPVSLWRNKKTGKLWLRVKQWPLGQMQVYGQETVSPGDLVVIHEGPPKADAARKKYPQYKHIAFCGGSSMARHHNWAFLNECIAVGCPDNDQTGRDAMDKVKALAIEAGCNSFGIIEWPDNMPNASSLSDLTVWRNFQLIRCHIL
jgi:hypothetical protein